MRKYLTLLGVVAALAFPATSASAVHNAPVGDGGGGACTPAIANIPMYFTTTMWSYAYFGGPAWQWGYWHGTKWICNGTYWFRLAA